MHKSILRSLQVKFSFVLLKLQGAVCVYLYVPLSKALVLLPRRLLTWFAGFDQTTGMILSLPRPGTIIIPVESLLLLDLQDGGVLVQDGQDDFVHVLSQT